MKKKLSEKSIQTLTSSAARAIKLAFEEYDVAKCKSAVARIDQLVSESKSDSTMCKARKAITPIKNLLEGYLDGREELLASDLKTIRKRAISYYREFKAETNSVLASRKKKSSLSTKEVDYDNLIDESKWEQIPLEELRKYFDQIKNVDAVPKVWLDNLKKYIEDAEFGQDYRNTILKNITDVGNVEKQLPAKLKGAFALIHAPVLPITKNVVDKDTLKKAGIRTQDITREYSVYMDQLLLVFPVQEHSNIKKALSANAKYVDECLQVINEHGEIEYQLMSNHFASHPNNLKSIAFAWLMPVDAMNKLLNSRILIKGWDFPIPRTWHTQEAPKHSRPPSTEVRQKGRR